MSRYQMALKCKDCGSLDTEVMKAKELSDASGDNSVLTSLCGTINPIFIIKALEAAFKAIGKIFSWMEEKEKGNQSVIVCKKCGYWERI